MMRAASRWLLTACVILAWAALAFAAASHPRQMLTAYLAAWIPLLGIPLGSLGMLMIHALTGGRWGEALLVSWADAVRLLPCALALSLPLLCGARWLFGWTVPTQHDGWPTAYLNLPFFYVRCAVCFACWFALACGALRRAGQTTWNGYAAGGLIAMVVTVSIWSVDWIMSRVAGWHSTALGMTLFSAQLLTGMAFAVCRDRAIPSLSASIRQDLANVLLAAALGWAYLVFMDYLTAWISDLPADTVWYLPRLRTSWSGLGVFAAGVQIACILCLLMRAVKRSAAWLRAVAGALLLVQFGYGLWLVLPDARPLGLTLTWIDPLAWLAVYGSTFCVWQWNRAREPHHRRSMVEAHP